MRKVNLKTGRLISAALWALPLAALLAVAPLMPALAQFVDPIEGKAEVADARTLIIAGQALRLTGIMVPTPDQACQRPGGPYACGFEAINALSFMTAGQWIQCQAGAQTPDGARLSRCFLGGRYDIGERMIREGWAQPTPRALPGYRDALADARVNTAGMWIGDFPLLRP